MHLGASFLARVQIGTRTIYECDFSEFGTQYSCNVFPSQSRNWNRNNMLKKTKNTPFNGYRNLWGEGQGVVFSHPSSFSLPQLLSPFSSFFPFGFISCLPHFHPTSPFCYPLLIARNHGWFCSWIFINQIASFMTSANKRWTIFGRGWWKLVSIFDHINNFIIICDRIKINCHHMFIRNPMMTINPMMCVKDRNYI